MFRHEDAPAQLAYQVICDDAWSTRFGSVKGFVGEQAIDVAIHHRNGAWEVNGTAAPAVQGCIHLDFAFTPATNFPHLRQLALTDGQSADLHVAWLDVPPGPLRILPQRYERRGDLSYWYEAPTVGYAALLELTRDGFIRRYPGLWEIEDARP